MNYVSKGYDLLARIKEIMSRKSFNTILIALITVFCFFGVMNVYAQESTGITISPDWEGIKSYSNVASGTEEDEDNMTSHQYLQTTNAAWSIISFIAPQITTGADSIENNQSIPEDMRGGLVGMADNMILYAYTNTPQVNVVAHLGEEWVPGYKENTTGLYAAENNSGYQELIDSGIDYLWKKFRDVAYLVFVVIMVVIGFMIMFRSKIGGQTLVSLGNTIPNIIVGLILITFSFAIAGIIIDIGGVLTSVLGSLFPGNTTSTANLWTLVMSIFSGNGSIGDGFASMGESISSAVQNGVGALIGSVVGNVLAGLLLIILIIPIIAIVLVGAIKLLITLYKAYFGILLGVALAPLQIMMGSFPGQKHMITNCFTGILRNVLVFPVVYFIVNIPNILNRDQDIILGFPSKLTGTTGQESMDVNATSFLFLFILKVLVLYFAAQAPKFIEGILPPNTSKGMVDGMTGAKASLSKIPLLGSLFK